MAYLPRSSAGSAGVFNGGRHVADEDALLDSLAAALEGRPERLEARTSSGAHLNMRTVAEHRLLRDTVMCIAIAGIPFEL